VSLWLDYLYDDDLVVRGVLHTVCPSSNANRTWKCWNRRTQRRQTHFTRELYFPDSSTPGYPWLATLTPG
jgi:hypothetical protein